MSAPLRSNGGGINLNQFVADLLNDNFDYDEEDTCDDHKADSAGNNKKADEISSQCSADDEEDDEHYNAKKSTWSTAHQPSDLESEHNKENVGGNTKKKSSFVIISSTKARQSSHALAEATMSKKQPSQQPPSQKQQPVATTADSRSITKTKPQRKVTFTIFEDAEIEQQPKKPQKQKDHHHQAHTQTFEWVEADLSDDDDIDDYKPEPLPTLLSQAPPEINNAQQEQITTTNRTATKSRTPDEIIALIRDNESNEITSTATTATNITDNIATATAFALRYEQGLMTDKPQNNSNNHAEIIDITTEEEEQEQDNVLISNNNDHDEFRTATTPHDDVLIEQQQQKDLALDENQLQCAQASLSRPLLILSGPGGGKTRVLCQRILFMLKNNIAPWNILCLTFTTKAAREMKQRISRMLTPEEANSITMWQNLEKLGFDPDSFQVINKAKQVKLMKDIMLEWQQQKALRRQRTIAENSLNIEEILIASQQVCRSASPTAAATSTQRTTQSRNRPSTPPSSETVTTKAAEEMLKWVHKQRAKGVTPEEFIDEMRFCYKLYEQKLQENSWVDFSTMIILAKNLLEENDEIRHKYQRRYQYILVDEFQDTSIMQFEFIKLLTGDNSRITAVGDDDQCIYTFRGTTSQIFDDFQRHYSNVDLHVLNINYRSTQRIVKAALSLITKNRERVPKDLVARNPGGSLITVAQFATASSQYEFIANHILDIVTPSANQRRFSYSQIAVLCRIRKYLFDVEKEFRKMGIPFVRHGIAKSLYEREDVLDILSLLSLLVYHDDQSFKRVYNKPKRKMGPAVLKYLEVLRDSEGLASLWDALVYATENNFPATAEERDKKKQGQSQGPSLTQQSIFQYTQSAALSQLPPEVTRKQETRSINTAMKAGLSQFHSSVIAIREQAKKLPLDRLIIYIVEQSDYSKHWNKLRDSDKKKKSKEEGYSSPSPTESDTEHNNDNAADGGNEEEEDRVLNVNSLLEDAHAFAREMLNEQKIAVLLGQQDTRKRAFSHWEHSKQGSDRQALFSASHDWVSRLRAFLDYIAVRSRQDEVDHQRSKSYEGVILTTIHQAKGLEWPIVFIMHCNEGVFPIKKIEGINPALTSLLDSDDAVESLVDSNKVPGKEHMETERKIAFVGITRAKERVIMTCLKESNPMAMQSTQTFPIVRSRFINELDQSCLHVVDGSNINMKELLHMAISSMPQHEVQGSSIINLDVEEDYHGAPHWSPTRSMHYSSPPRRQRIPPHDDNNNNNIIDSSDFAFKLTQNTIRCLVANEDDDDFRKLIEETLLEPDKQQQDQDQDRHQLAVNEEQQQQPQLMDEEDTKHENADHHLPVEECPPSPLLFSSSSSSEASDLDMDEHSDFTDDENLAVDNNSTNEQEDGTGSDIGAPLQNQKAGELPNCPPSRDSDGDMDMLSSKEVPEAAANEQQQQQLGHDAEGPLPNPKRRKRKVVFFDEYCGSPIHSQSQLSQPQIMFAPEGLEQQQQQQILQQLSQKLHSQKCNSEPATAAMELKHEEQEKPSSEENTVKVAAKTSAVAPKTTTKKTTKTTAAKAAPRPKYVSRAEAKSLGKSAALLKSWCSGTANSDDKQQQQQQQKQPEEDTDAPTTTSSIMSATAIKKEVATPPPPAAEEKDRTNQENAQTAAGSDAFSSATVAAATVTKATSEPEAAANQQQQQHQQPAPQAAAPAPPARAPRRVPTGITDAKLSKLLTKHFAEYNPQNPVVFQIGQPCSNKDCDHFMTKDEIAQNRSQPSLSLSKPPKTNTEKNAIIAQRALHTKCNKCNCLFRPMMVVKYKLPSPDDEDNNNPKKRKKGGDLSAATATAVNMEAYCEETEFYTEAQLKQIVQTMTTSVAGMSKQKAQKQKKQFVAQITKRKTLHIFWNLLYLYGSISNARLEIFGDEDKEEEEEEEQQNEEEQQQHTNQAAVTAAKEAKAGQEGVSSNKNSTARKKPTTQKQQHAKKEPARKKPRGAWAHDAT